MNEQLEARSNGALSLIEGDAKFVEIARYGPRMMLHDFHFANFSDSRHSANIRPSLFSYLGARLHDDYFLAHAHQSYQHLQRTGLDLQAGRCDLFYLVRLFLHCPADLSLAAPPGYEDVFFKDLGVLVAHGRDEKGNLWDFAAKAGHNAEHHNHNDCGGYLLNINGTPMIIEIGAPEYTRDYFRQRRYEYLAARTLGHSLPIVNGYEQAAGPHYAAKVLQSEFDDSHVHFLTDITQCYPSSAECGEIVRDFQWDKTRGHLLVKDYYELSKTESFESAIITDKNVSLTEEEAVLDGDGCRIVVRPLPNTFFAGVEEHEYHDHNGTPRKVQRIILKPQDLHEQRSMGYEIRMAE